MGSIVAKLGGNPFELELEFDQLLGLIVGYIMLLRVLHLVVAVLVNEQEASVHRIDENCHLYQ